MSHPLLFPIFHDPIIVKQLVMDFHWFTKKIGDAVYLKADGTGRIGLFRKYGYRSYTTFEHRFPTGNNE